MVHLLKSIKCTKTRNLRPGMEHLCGCLDTLNPMIICVRQETRHEPKEDGPQPSSHPQQRTIWGSPHSTHLAVGLQLQHLSGGRIKFAVLIALVQKVASGPYLIYASRIAEYGVGCERLTEVTCQMDLLKEDMLNEAREHISHLRSSGWPEDTPFFKSTRNELMRHQYYY